MSDPGQFKNFTTRKFRADLHYRLRIFAATKEISVEIALNEVIEKGLNEIDKMVELERVKQKKKCDVCPLDDDPTCENYFCGDE